MDNLPDSDEETGSHRPENDRTKALKEAISKYYRQVLVGCGRFCCSNENCASSGKLPKLTTNEAAARAIICVRDRVRICEPVSEALVARPPEPKHILNEENVQNLFETCRTNQNWQDMINYLDCVLGDRVALLNSFRNRDFKPQPGQTSDVSEMMDTSSEQQLISQRKRRAQVDVDGAEMQLEVELNTSVMDANDIDRIDRKCSRGEETNGDVESAIVHSSQSNTSTGPVLSVAQDDKLLRSSSSSNNVHREDDASQKTSGGCGWNNVPAVNDDTYIGNLGWDMTTARSTGDNADIVNLLLDGKTPTDMDAARHCFRMLFVETNEHEHYLTAAMGAVSHLCGAINYQLRSENIWEHDPAGIVHIISLMFELPFVSWLEFMKAGLISLCEMCSNLPKDGHIILASVWAEFGSDWILDRIYLLQQFITLRVYSVIDSVGSLPVFNNRTEPVPAAIQTLSIFYKAALLRSKRDMILPLDTIMTQEMLEAQDTDLSAVNPEFHDESNIRANNRRRSFSSFLEAFTHDVIELDEEEEIRLAREAPIDGWLVTKTSLPLSELLNETLSENMSVQDDFIAYKNGRSFSVMPEYSFIITTEAKQRFLYLNNKIRQRSERRQALADALTFGLSMEPYLRLNVRRDRIIRDALDGLAAVAMDNSANFKKQLRVQFDGEQAVDEGGVSKEFYQLITDELFCPDYGMFVLNKKTGLYWFNSQCTFCDNEYGLIGLLFGLAIYNNIVIDVRFPTLLYVKLLARPAVFDELAQIDEELYSGLRQLLECDDDVESIYSYTFQVSYRDVYGNIHDEELIPNGADIPVTNANKKEFVAYYSDFLLNRSVKRQFDAFSKGFNKVANRGLLRRLFVPSEVEQLVCGVLDLDFDMLSKYTKYQNGFSETSQTIQDFWNVAKAMNTDEKKMLLQFITGSDRVPVGGLAKLEIIIARNGDNKERLPTAHTCYNVMLLPDYKDLEVTRERITKAISYSRGFGLQ